MKSTISSNRLFIPLLLVIVFLAAPSRVFASVLITEVMYDVSGSDSGREWIEITNTGSDPVDTDGYRLAEGGTNHLISVISGAATLGAGESAVIADNGDKFLLDYPNFAGTLFKSSFSLSNTGETVELKDSSLVTLDSITYDSTGGAAGDGNTLQRSGDTLVPAAPTPGTFGSVTLQPEPSPAPEPEPAADPEPAPTSTPTTTPAAETATTTPAASSTPPVITSTPTPPQAPTSASTQPVAQTSASQPAQTPAQTQTSSQTKSQTAATSASQPTSSAPAASQTTPVVATHAQSVPQPASSASSGSSAKKSTGSAAFGGASQSAAAGAADVFQTSGSSTDDTFWMTLLGLAALIVVGIAGALYVKRPGEMSLNKGETIPSAQEFKIEG